MALLALSGVRAPVTLHALRSVLYNGLPAQQMKDLMERFPPLLPRALKTLNGETYLLIAPELLSAAAEREEIMANMPHGWGVCDPPPYATAYRLLVSVGVDAALLPAYVTLPTPLRERITLAWVGTCKRFGWAPCNPPADDAAIKRRARNTSWGRE